MKIIADSSASRTEWALVDGATVVEHAFTKGLNPFFHTRRDISHSIRFELPEAFFKRRWERIHFYGAGCTRAIFLATRAAPRISASGFSATA